MWDDDEDYYRHTDYANQDDYYDWESAPAEMIRDELDVEAEYQESSLERENDRWNYYEASLQDEPQPLLKSKRQMRSERSQHFRQKRHRKEYHSRPKEEKVKRNKRFKVQNNIHPEIGRLTMIPRYRRARKEGEEIWYPLISKDEYEVGSSSRKSNMLKGGNGIPFLPLSNTHAGASSDHDITVEEDYKEEEEWI